MAGLTPGAANNTADPLQPTYVAPTTTNVNVSPTDAETQLKNAYGLQNQQSSNNLANILASQGITGGDAITAENTLQGQLASSEAPALASLITGSQQLGLNQAQGNAQSSNAAAEFDANAKNSAGNSLAAYLMQNYGLDMSAFSNILDSGLSGGQALNNSTLNSNANATSALGSQENADTSNNWNSFLSALALAGAA